MFHVEHRVESIHIGGAGHHGHLPLERSRIPAHHQRARPPSLPGATHPIKGAPVATVPRGTFPPAQPAAPQWQPPVPLTALTEAAIRTLEARGLMFHVEHHRSPVGPAARGTRPGCPLGTTASRPVQLPPGPVTPAPCSTWNTRGGTPGPLPPDPPALKDHRPRPLADYDAFLTTARWLFSDATRGTSRSTDRGGGTSGMPWAPLRNHSCCPPCRSASPSSRN